MTPNLPVIKGPVIPLPCRIISHEPSRLKTVLDANGVNVAWGQEPERAEQICTALNSHAAMKEALERISNGNDDATMREWAQSALAQLPKENRHE